MASLGLNLPLLPPINLTLGGTDENGDPIPDPPPPGPCEYMNSLIAALAYAIDENVENVTTRQVALTHLAQVSFRVNEHCTANPDPAPE